MEFATPYERIQELINVIELSPTPLQLVRFLSKRIDPANEINAVGWLQLEADGRIRPIALSGSKKSFDPSESIGFTDNNVVAESLRQGEPKFFDMVEVFKNYSDSTHRDSVGIYQSGAVLPISKNAVIGFASFSSYQKLLEYKEYYELIQKIVSLWFSKNEFARSPSANIKQSEGKELTSRQSEILSLISEGRTNSSIATILGYSESLIRQETITIYRKLGVRGRKEILAEKERTR